MCAQVMHGDRHDDSGQAPGKAAAVAMALVKNVEQHDEAGLRGGETRAPSAACASPAHSHSPP